MSEIKFNRLVSTGIQGNSTLYVETTEAIRWAQNEIAQLREKLEAANAELSDVLLDIGEIRTVLNIHLDTTAVEGVRQAVELLHIREKQLLDANGVIREAREREFSDDEYICIRDAVDKLICSVGKDVDGDQSECSLIDEFIDEFIRDVINPLSVHWVDDDDWCGYRYAAPAMPIQDDKRQNLMRFLSLL